VGRALLAHVARITEDANGLGIMFNVLDWNTERLSFTEEQAPGARVMMNLLML
jgi:hypothetical protein